MPFERDAASIRLDRMCTALRQAAKDFASARDTGDWDATETAGHLLTLAALAYANAWHAWNETLK